MKTEVLIRMTVSSIEDRFVSASVVGKRETTMPTSGIKSLAALLIPLMSSASHVVLAIDRSKHLTSSGSTSYTSFNH